MIYTGIGSRDTPIEILDSMYAMAQFMAAEGHLLRSGGARGSDVAFEKGCIAGDGAMEIYLPHRGFNKNLSDLYEVSKPARLLALSLIHI